MGVGVSKQLSQYREIFSAIAVIFRELFKFIFGWIYFCFLRVINMILGAVCTILVWIKK